MEQADLVLSAAGQTLYELACVGSPTVAFQVADNQKGQLEAMEKAKVLINAGPVQDPETFPRGQKCLIRLLNDSLERQEMADAGQRLVDGQGAYRVAGLK